VFVDGERVDRRQIGVPTGNRRAVEVTRQFDAPGTYDVGVHVRTSSGVGTENQTVVVTERQPDIGVESVELNRTTLPAGGSVLVTATVTNDGTGDGTEAVGLTVFGEEVASEQVTLGVNESQTVTFVQRFDAVGEYDVLVGEERVTVTVEPNEGGDSDPGGEPDDETTTTTPGFGVVLALLALLAAALLARRRS
jgi:PGF-CTERM protein